MKSFKTVQLVATGLAAVSLSQTQAFAASSDMQIEDGTDVAPVSLDQFAHHGCDVPANRDYHAILSAFEAGAEGEYKFTGCGTAI